MNQVPTYDVAVIGYGPTGATAANLLGRLGLKVVVIERDPDIYRRARAISTDEEVMRIWQSLGLSDRLQEDMLSDRPVAFVDAEGVPFAETTIAGRGCGHPPQQFIYQPMIDHVLRGIAVSDFADVLFRAAAFAHVVATGRAVLDVPAAEASRMRTLADQLEAAARQELAHQLG